MRYIIELKDRYFCCSSLPLLNGDIKDVIGHRPESRDLYLTLQRILGIIQKEYTWKKPRPRKLRREYKRMIALYKFRIREYEKLGGLL